MSRKPSILTEEEKRKRQNNYNKKYRKTHSSEEQKRKRAVYNHDYHLNYVSKPENKEKHNLYYKTHLEQCREHNKQYHRKIHRIVLEHYGLRCACCGESTYEFLELDHINNDGTKHRKEIGTNINHWLYKNNFPDGFQTLCSNCNNAKGRWGECPHKRKV